MLMARKLDSRPQILLGTISTICTYVHNYKYIYIANFVVCILNAIKHSISDNARINNTIMQDKAYVHLRWDTNIFKNTNLLLKIFNEAFY